MTKEQRLENVIKKTALSILKEKEGLPENFSDVAVNVYPSKYGLGAKISILMKEPFTEEESDFFDVVVYEIKQVISKVFKDTLTYGVSSSISTMDNYEKVDKPYYEKLWVRFKSSNLSENKKPKNVLITENQLKTLIRHSKNENRNN
jgi:hypothetical protein